MQDFERIHGPSRQTLLFLRITSMEQPFFFNHLDIVLNNICYGTKAFVLDPARIYLNLKGKYPCGSVDPADAESILTNLENIFKTLEIDSKKVIRSAYRNEEIFTGPYASLGPDLTLVGNEGFDLKARMNTDELFGNGIFTGKHTRTPLFSS